MSESKPARILIVEDHAEMLQVLRKFLTERGFEIQEAVSGEAALDMVSQDNPDIILLDIMLPDVNGLDILKAIKAKTEIPVVMLSAKDTPKETGQAKELGADDFIPKPFRDEELVGKIHELIGE